MTTSRTRRRTTARAMWTSARTVRVVTHTDHAKRFRWNDEMRDELFTIVTVENAMSEIRNEKLKLENSPDTYSEINARKALYKRVRVSTHKDCRLRPGRLDELDQCFARVRHAEKTARSRRIDGVGRDVINPPSRLPIGYTSRTYPIVGLGRRVHKRVELCVEACSRSRAPALFALRPTALFRARVATACRRTLHAVHERRRARTPSPRSASAAGDAARAEDLDLDRLSLCLGAVKLDDGRLCIRL